MILIADSGSTKTNWALMDGREKPPVLWQTSGMNPNYITDEEISTILSKCTATCQQQPIERIHYYGSGIGNDVNAGRLQSLLASAFSLQQIEVNSDLLGAARALSGTKPCVICILGTGSNACLYNGSKTEMDNLSLGYMLGDEGSGFMLGKHLLTDYYYKRLPETIARFLDENFQMGKTDILKEVYQKPFANRYIASFATVYASFRGEQYIETKLAEIFSLFIDAYLGLLPAKNLPLHAIGSVAFGFQDVLRQIGDSKGFTFDRIEKDPIQGLVSFHT